MMYKQVIDIQSEKKDTADSRRTKDRKTNRQEYGLKTEN